MRTLSVLGAALLALGLLPVAGPRPAQAYQQEAEGVGRTALDDSPAVRRADTTAADSLEPYRTDRSTLEQVLAFPSTLLHWITRPIGAAVVWVERRGVRGRVENLFWNDAHTRGIYPLLTVGGGSVASLGVAMVDHRLFGTNRDAELRLRFTNPQNFSARGTYSDPTPLDRHSFAELEAQFRRDGDKNLFLTEGLFSEREDQAAVPPFEDGAETSYGVSRFRTWVRLGREPAGTDGIGGSLFARYEWVDVGAGEDDEVDEEDAPFPEAFSTTGSFLTGGASAFFDGSRGKQRTTGGSRLFLRYSYTGSIDEDPFAFHHLLAEVQHFVPLRFLPPYRRLAFRARIEKAIPIAGQEAPFYELPGLGGPASLRGFARDRFRDGGALLLSAEYHYPIWGNLDALLFADAGQVFDDVTGIRPGDFHWSGGVGVRVYSRSRLSVRLELGIGAGGARAFTDTRSNFVTSVRRGIEEGQ